MKKLMLIVVFLFVVTFSFSDYIISRGPNQGEIYFIGLTNTGNGIYYSTDYGETATCKDYESYFYGSICADKTEGVLYLRDFYGALYVSTNYGLTGSWEYRNSNIQQQVNSGRVEGEIFSSFSKHSDDFGYNFINHNYNGFFGSKLEVEIDNEQGVGYVLVNQYGINDSVFLLKSIDNFENLELQYSFFLKNLALVVLGG